MDHKWKCILMNVRKARMMPEASNLPIIVSFTCWRFSHKFHKVKTFDQLVILLLPRNIFPAISPSLLPKMQRGAVQKIAQGVHLLLPKQSMILHLVGDKRNDFSQIFRELFHVVCAPLRTLITTESNFQRWPKKRRHEKPKKTWGILAKKIHPNWHNYPQKLYNFLTNW